MKLTDLFVEWRVDLKHFKAGFAQAREQIKSFDKRFSETTARLSSKWTALAGTIGGTVLFKKAIGETVRFQKGLKEVESLLDADLRPMMKGFGEDILRVAQQYGEGTASLTKGLYDIISASVPADQAVRVLEESVKAAKAGLTETSVAADALTTVLNAYGMSASEAANVSDTFFTTIKLGKTTFAELAPAVGRVASVAASAGVSFEEVGAAMATLTRSGLSTDEAVTALRQTILTFLKPMDEGAEAARRFGLELSAQTLASEGLIGAMEKLKDAGAEQMAQIFGNVRALNGATILTQNLEGAQRDLAAQLKNTGMTMAAYQVNTDSAAQAIDKFKAAWEVFGIRFAENVLPYLTKLLDFFGNLDLVLSGSIISVQEWAQKVAHWVEELFADVAHVMGKLPGVLGEPFREYERQMRRSMALQEKALENLRETWEQETNKRMGYVRIESQETVQVHEDADHRIVKSAEETTEKLGKESEKRTEKSKEEKEKELQALIEKDKELLAATVNRNEAIARIEREFQTERNRLEYELLRTGSAETKQALIDLEEQYIGRMKAIDTDLFSWQSKLDAQRAEEHKDNLDEMTRAEQKHAEAVIGSLQAQQKEIEKTRAMFQAFADQVVATREFDIHGIGAMGGYVSTKGTEFFTLGAYEQMSKTFLANMDRYKQELQAWVAGGRRGAAPPLPSTAGLEQLAGASLKGIRNVPPEVYEAQEMIQKLLTYDTNDWLKEFGIAGGRYETSGGRSGSTRVYVPPSPPAPPPSVPARVGGKSMSIAPGWSSPADRSMVSSHQAPGIVPATAQQVVNQISNSYSFTFNTGDSIMQRDVKNWVLSELVPILDELARTGRIPWMDQTRGF